jgi:hypothetical protein
MTPAEANILTTLEELKTAVAQMSSANPKPDLKPLFARLDELTEKLPPDADRQLLHFLHRKSYEKAREWLQGQR